VYFANAPLLLRHSQTAEATGIHASLLAAEQAPGMARLCQRFDGSQTAGARVVKKRFLAALS
jgi:hypothetical protein